MDAKVIPVCHTKGGVGKSTLTWCLAGDAALRGLRVLIIDTDTQGTVTKFAANAPEEHPYPAEVISLREMREARQAKIDVGEQVGPEVEVSGVLEHLIGDYDLIFIDVQGRAESIELQAALAAADLVVAVCIPRPAEVYAMEELLGLLDELATVGIEPPVRLLVNGLKSKKPRREEKLQLLKLLNLPIERFRTPIREKAAIVEAVGKSLLPHDLEKNVGAQEAVKEIGACVESIGAVLEIAIPALPATEAPTESQVVATATPPVAVAAEEAPPAPEAENEKEVEETAVSPSSLDTVIITASELEEIRHAGR